MSNDRFKFRVWDELINEYRKEGTIQLSGNGQPFIIDGNMQPQDIDNVIIEQFTGLADKNGKLIYEGDVFEATVLNSCDCDENIGKRIRGQVAYFEDNACFTFAAYSPINLWEIEIIGNIHDDQFRDLTKMMEE